MQEPCGKPVVMIADDDPIAMAIMVAELEAAGCRAVVCPDGIEAIAYLATEERIDALVTDVHMPGSIDGLFLAVEARSQRPGLPVVYMSGRAVAAQRMVAGSRFLEKPCAMGRLAGLVRAMTCPATAPT